MGWQYTVFKTEKFYSSHYSKHIDLSNKLLVKVTQPLEEKLNSYKAVLRVKRFLGDTSFDASGIVLAYFKKGKWSQNIKYGDELIIENRLIPIEEAKNPNQFNYKNYLNLNQIQYQVFVDSNSINKTKLNTGNPIIAFSQKIRAKLYSYLRVNGVEGKQLKVASALLLGYRENLDKDLVKSYSSAGAMHVLAVSGLHVGILYLLLANLLKVFSRIKGSNTIIALILISFLWFYALMTGMSASVMRSATMFTFIIIGDKFLNRTSSIYNTLAASALILMLIDPFVVYQVGFQLSYSAVLGIVYLQPKLYRLFYNPNALIQKIWAITCVSIAAQIATFPLSLHYFHQFPVYFFISNLIVIPAAIGIFYLGVALFVSAPFGGISLVVGKLLNAILIVLNEAVFFTEKIKGSLIEEIAFTVFETYLLYGIIICFLFALYYRRLRMVYLSIILCFGFVGIQLWDQHKSIHQKRITFYSIKNETAVEFVKGKTVYFISSNNLSKEWSAMQFNVHNNWNNQNITTKIYFNSDSLGYDFQDSQIVLKKGVFLFDTVSVAFLNNSNFKLKTDYCVVSKSSLKVLKEKGDGIQTKNFIFDSSIPLYNVKYYKRNIDTLSIKVISLAKKYYSVEF